MSDTVLNKLWVLSEYASKPLVSLYGVYWMFKHISIDTCFLGEYSDDKINQWIVSYYQNFMPIKIIKMFLRYNRQAAFR